MLTSSAFVRPLSMLWRLGETQEHVRDFADEYFIEFGNTTTERLVGTQGVQATVSTSRGEGIIWAKYNLNHGQERVTS